MDKMGASEYFLLNVLMGLILATWCWGINALIIFGVVMTPVYMLVLISIFIEGAFDFAPLRAVMRRFRRGM